MKATLKISKTWTLFVGSLLIVILISTGVQLFLNISSKTISIKEIERIEPKLKTDVLRLYDVSNENLSFQ